MTQDLGILRFRGDGLAVRVAVGIYFGGICKVAKSSMAISTNRIYCRSSYADMRGRSYPAAYPEVLNPVPAFYGGSVVRVLSMQDGAGSSRVWMLEVAAVSTKSLPRLKAQKESKLNELRG
jgi:hypothetical protein